MTKDENRIYLNQVLMGYEELLTPKAFRVLKIMVAKEEKKQHEYLPPSYISHILYVMAYRKRKNKFGE